MSTRFLLEESCIMLCELAVDNIGTYIDVITQIDAEQQYRM